MRDEGECEIPQPDETLANGLVSVSREKFIEAQERDSSLKGLWEKARSETNSEYCVSEEILYRITRDRHGAERKQIVIPKDFREEILKLCHDGISGHTGILKCKDKIFRHYFWPNIVRDTEAFVKSCDSCQRIDKGNEVKRVPMKLVPIISEIFTRINCDLVGPLPESEKGNRYILTALCMASKYPEAIPIIDTRSESVIDGLLIIFSRLGFPREIQCDLGTCFTSVLTTTFFEKFGIRVVHSSVHRPQSNPIERWHRSVKRLIKVLCLENGNSWERNLPHALLALRTVTHESTGYSPAELIHGRNLRTPEALLYEKWANVGEEETPVTEYIFTLINRLKRCQELAVERMETSRERRKLWYDRGTVERSFKPGDLVLVMNTARTNKMSVNWIGPGTIESKLSDTNYIVNVPGRREKSQIYHINLIKPYHQRVEHINVLMSEKLSPEILDADLDLSYPTADPDVYDFKEIVRESGLEERCSPEQIEEIGRVLQKHRGIFSNDPGRTHLIEHDIELVSEQPFRIKPYRTSPRQTEILKREIKRMLELKIIEVGESDYVSPLILVEVTGKDPRPCIDYRKLNSLTRTQYFPLPNIEEKLEIVSAAKYITLIDLTKGYWQIPLTPRAQRYAAFATSFGSFRPLVMPFGLVNASYLFSKFMAELLAGCENFCVTYIDDVAIFSSDWTEHLKHIDIILKRLADAKLKIKPMKCKFAQNTVKYLGHVVGGGRRTPAEAKIKAVMDLPEPKTKTEIRRALGMIGYYARYIKGYATMVEPLTSALKGKNKREPVHWTPEMEKAFREVKRKLTENPILHAPDYNHEFILQTDASEKGLGVILAQRKNNEEHPVLYLSRKFTGPERNYSVTEKECAAIIYGIKKLRPYLDGQRFTIESDHNPLVWLKTNAGNNQRLIRWALTLQPYNYTVVHRPGKDIQHVDGLSRL